VLEISNGIDLVEINRFDAISPGIRERFLHRVFTARELLDAADKSASLAGKFSAKEATAKALGCGIGAIHWQDIEILPDEQGKPVLHLHGIAREMAEHLGWTSWSVSISHTKEHAVAAVNALIEKE
jgi:holo-[acyl-carrier protein] synthase